MKKLKDHPKFPPLELHEHDSIPTHFGEENHGCIICMKNRLIEELGNLEIPEEMDEGKIIGALARGYCTEENKSKVLDPTLIKAQVKELSHFGTREDMKKLKDHPKFPKEKKYTGCECEGDNECICLGECNGYNQALRELGEIEILEELDEGKLKNIFDQFEVCGEQKLSLMLTREHRDKIIKKLMSNFGTRKVNEAELYKIILTWWDGGGIGRTLEDLAYTIVEYINNL